jgi:hypothetical protein
VGQVRRRDRDGIPRLTSDGRLSREDGIGIECVWGCRRDTDLSEQSPELSSLDHRIGRKGQVSQAATRIENVLVASQTSDRADSNQLAAHLVMGDFGMTMVAPAAETVLSQVSQRTTCGLLGARTIRPSGPLSSRISRAMINKGPRRVYGGGAAHQGRA